ncbi:MAG TPA: hypothetical protein VIP70_04190 [Nitrososphaeraceae archaeon]
MTFKDLQKIIVQSHSNAQQNELFDRLKDKPFWIWNKEQHKQEDIRTKGDCCFNHIIGLPTKEKIEKPMFDYEKLLYDSLLIPDYSNPLNHSFKHKHLWVKKATGLGVTEFFLRLMAWLCLHDNSYRNSQICIVTGPNQDIAIKLIKRMKGLFEPKLGITFDTKETVLELNGCSIEAYPSNHLDAYRALDNPKFILLDEADFFRKSEQEDVRHVSERYIAKSDPFIVMVSTPYAPDGLFDKIEKEPEETCIYKRVLLDYTYGLDKIYAREEIDKAKQSPSFEREYNLKYLGLIGNVFSQQGIDKATNVDYNPDRINPNAKKSIGIDPGFGSSKFAIVVTQYVDGKIQIIYADEFDRPNFQTMISTIWQLKQRCGYISNIYVDSANPEVWESLKREFGERYDEQHIKETAAYCKKYNLDIEDRMVVVPVPFSTEGAQMLQHAKALLEDENNLVAINPSRFHKLVTALRTAVANEYKLDKEQTSFDDILDAFRLALIFYKFVENKKDEGPIISIVTYD